MAIQNKKTWGKDRLARIHGAWDTWKSRHPGVYSEPHASATYDAGDWCASISLAVRQLNGDMIAGAATTPKGRCSFWNAIPATLGGHPEIRTSKDEAMDTAIEAFERECATL